MQVCNKGIQVIQIIPISSFGTSPTQVSKVNHGMIVDLPLEGLQVILWREHRACREDISIYGMFYVLWKSSERYQCVHDKGALYMSAKRSHLKGKFFFLLILLVYTENWRFCCCIRTVLFFKLIHEKQNYFLCWIVIIHPSWLIHRYVLVNYKNMNETLARVVENGHSYWL